MKIPKVHFLFFTFIMAGIVFILPSCGCPSDGDSGEEILVLTTDTNDSNATWREDIRVTYSNYYSLRQRLFEAEEVNVNGNRLMVSNSLYQYQTGREISIPDSLKECNFGSRKNLMICAVTSSDSLYNAQLDTTLNIKNAKSKLYEIEVEIRENKLGILNSKLLIEDKAEFKNNDRYSVATYHNPTYDAESDQIFVQKSTEIREFVLDSAGTIVNDILFYRELEQLANTAESAFVSLLSYGSLNSNEAFPKFNRSLNSQKYTFSYRGNVYIQDFGSEEPELLRPGIRPVFFDNGSKLVYWKEDESIEIYDLDTNSHFYISGQNKVRSPVVHSEDADIIYYLSDNGIHRFNASTKEANLMMSFSDYIEERQNENENLTLRLEPVELFFNTENPDDLTVLLFSDYSIYVPCNN